MPLVGVLSTPEGQSAAKKPHKIEENRRTCSAVFNLKTMWKRRRNRQPYSTFIDLNPWLLFSAEETALRKPTRPCNRYIRTLFLRVASCRMLYCSQRPSPPPRQVNRCGEREVCKPHTDELRTPFLVCRLHQTAITRKAGSFFIAGRNQSPRRRDRQNSRRCRQTHRRHQW